MFSASIIIHLGYSADGGVPARKAFFWVAGDPLSFRWRKIMAADQYTRVMGDIPGPFSITPPDTDTSRS